MSETNAIRERKHLMVFVPRNLNLLYGVLSYLSDTMDVHGERVVVLETSPDDDDGESRYAVVFKVRTSYQFENVFHVTVNEKPFEFRLIQIHSKSRNRVYYTLNALNMLIQKECGRDDRDHELAWDNYEQSIIYTMTHDDEKELRIVGTKLTGVVNLQPRYSKE